MRVQHLRAYRIRSRFPALYIRPNSVRPGYAVAASAERAVGPSFAHIRCRVKRSRLVSVSFGPFAIDDIAQHEFRRIKNGVMDVLTLPGVRHMHQPVARLDDAWIRELIVVTRCLRDIRRPWAAFENQRGVP